MFVGVRRCHFKTTNSIIQMNIFVSGLNYSMSSEELTEVFSQFGAVASAKVVTDRATGRSRGFGFVEMPSEDEGRAAIAQLDQTDVSGRKINVKEAEERPQRSSNDRPRGNFGGGRREGGFKPRFNRDGGNGGGGYDRGNRY
jgi:RNA recognition motif-containing protein